WLELVDLELRTRRIEGVQVVGERLFQLFQREKHRELTRRGKASRLDEFRDLGYQGRGFHTIFGVLNWHLVGRKQNRVMEFSCKLPALGDNEADSARRAF